MSRRDSPAPHFQDSTGAAHHRRSSSRQAEVQEQVGASRKSRSGSAGKEPEIYGHANACEAESITVKLDGQTLREIIADRKFREKLARMEAHVGEQPEWNLFSAERIRSKQIVSDAELEEARERWREERVAREKEKRA
jgi:hypothetical protein